jgi:2-dehydropantoate 2-reductase
MRTLVLGSGAIGSVIAGYLTREDRDIRAIDPWFQHVEKVKRDGLTISAVEGELTVPIRIDNMDALESVGTFDTIVIAPKSYDTTWMARLARDHMHENTIVLSAQNGMNDGPIGSIVGSERVVGCVVVMACELGEAGHARRTSAADEVSLVFGEFGKNEITDRVTQLAEYFAPMGNVATAPDVAEERWGKLSLNTMSNGLAGLTGHTTRELWSKPGVIDVLIALGHEVAVLADKRGIHMSPVLHVIPHELLLSATSVNSEQWEQVRQLLIEVASRRTGKRENTPSLLQDVKKGRRTEIDYINGWVVTEAAHDEVETPLNNALVDEIRSVEDGRRHPAAENAAPLVELVSKFYA